ncbi:hypothetical protein GCM10023223_43160 [Stackebrandtia albiflava]
MRVMPERYGGSGTGGICRSTGAVDTAALGVPHHRNGTRVPNPRAVAHRHRDGVTDTATDRRDPRPVT